MKRTTTILAILLLGSLFLTGSAMALSLGDILDDKYGSSVSTQYYSIYDTNAEAAQLTDYDGTNDDATAFLFFEIAGFAPSLEFGIYEYTDDGAGSITFGDKLQLFDGSDSGLTSSTVSFNLTAGTATNANGSTATIDDTFGFYVNTPENNGYTYYSHTFLNTDGYDHMKIYDIPQLNGSLNPDLMGSDIIVAIEDLYGGGDQDFNDMVIGVSDVVSVPEPATMLLLGTGLIGLAGLRRRFKK